MQSLQIYRKQQHINKILSYLFIYYLFTGWSFQRERERERRGDIVGSNKSYKPITNTAGFAPSFVNYKQGCTRPSVASDKVYQLLDQGRWFSPASSTTKTGRHDIAEIWLKVALNTKIQIQMNIISNII